MTSRPEAIADLDKPATSEAEPEPDISLRKRILKPQTLISFVIAGVVLYFFVTRLDLDIGAAWAQIRTANPLLYLLAFGVYYLGFPLRGVRWRLLLSNSGSNPDSLPSVPSLARIIFLGWFANCIVVAKLGDAFRAYLLKRATDISFSRTFGTILAERVFDMIVLFVLLGLSALTVLSQLESGNSSSTLFILAVGLAFVVIIAIGLLTLRHGSDFIGRLLPVRLKEPFQRLTQGTLSSFKRLPLVAVLTILVWASEAAALFLISRSLGVRVDVPMIIFVALAGSLLTTVPALPGGLALVEGGMTGALSLVLSGHEALSVALLYRTISYWSLVALGLIVYLLTMPKRPATQRRPSQE